MTDGQTIRPLTSLRFFAAAWVVLFHYWPKLHTDIALPALLDKGYLGVELFFILSGFILCHVYRTALEEGRFRYGHFLWARLARVYPLHLATLAGMIILGVGAGLLGLSIDRNILSWESLPANIFLVQAWGFAPAAAFNHPSWSISAEWFAYLSFPVFGWAALALKDRPLVAVGGAVLLMVGLYSAFESLTGFPLTRATIAWGALRIIPCFALGCALHAFWRARPAVSRLLAGLGTGFCLVGVITVSSFSGPDALIVPLLGGLILFLARLAQTGAKVLEQGPLVYLGEISYSIYMICVPWKIVFVNLASRFLQISDERLPLGLWLVFLVSVVPLAACSYHLIENPARARMKLWSDSWDARRRSAVPA